MKEIPVTKPNLDPLVAMVDDDLFDELSSYRWRLSTYGYAISFQGRTSVYMHRIVNSTPDGMLTDHINGNKLDNRRANLRNATSLQNARNISGMTHYGGKPCSSLYKGVSRAGDRWRAALYPSTGKVHLGHFDTQEEAALAYDAKAREVYGEFAKLNFPVED